VRVGGLSLILALSLLVPSALPAQAVISSSYASLGSHPIAPGVSRDWGTVTAAAGRQSVNVVEVNPDRSGISFRASLARNRVTARQRTTDQALAYSREGRRVVATINGSTFGSWPMGHVAARGLNVRDRELLTAGRIGSTVGGPILGFGVDSRGRPMIGTPALDMQVTMPSGATGTVNRVNQGRLTDEAVLFTPRFDSHTWTDNNGDEFVIEGLDLPLEPTGTYHGRVAAVRRGLGDSPIGAGQVVLSATGQAALAYGSLAVGDAVTIKLTIEEGWRDVVHAVGGRELLVRNGVTEILPYRQAHVTAANPRSAVGITAQGKVILLTVDGRSSDSGGLNLEELAELMIERGAVSALNLDGGGSTTLAVRRPGDIEVGIVNTPSDGAERTIATTIQVISTIATGSVDEVLLSPKSASLYVGQTQQYAVKAHDAAYNGIAIDPAKLDWQVTNDGATVDAKALLTARKAGVHTVTAGIDGKEDSAELTVLADNSVPVVTPPLVQLRSGVTSPKTEAKLRVNWTAADEGMAPMSELQRRVNGGSWTSVSLTSSTATAANTRVAFGLSIQFRVRARDGAGNVSAWSLGPTVRVSLVDELDSAVVRSGEWLAKSSTSAIRGQYARSRTVGAQLSLAFNGVQVAWIGLRGPKHGPADVYLSGSLVTRIKLRNSTLLQRQVLYVSPLAGSATATTIAVRNAGTLERPRADVDAFLVLVPLD